MTQSSPVSPNPRPATASLRSTPSSVTIVSPGPLVGLEASLGDVRAS